MSDKHSNASMVAWLTRESLPYWRHVLGLLLTGLLTIPLSLLTPVPLKLAVDHVIGAASLPVILQTLLPDALQGSRGGLLLFAAGLMVIIALLTQVTYLGSSLLRTRTSERLVLGFRARLFSHVQRLSLSYHDSRGTADSTYRILWDTAAIKTFVVDGVVPFLTAAGTLLAMMVIMIRLSWALALVCLLLPAAIYLVSRPFNHRLRTAWEDVKSIEGSTMSALQEVLTGLRVVKAFGSEDREKDRLVRLSKAGMDSQYRAALVGGTFSVMVGVTISSAAAAMLYIGVRQVQAGALTVGDLVIVMWYLTQIYAPLQTLGSMVTHMQSALVSTGRALTILEQQPDVVENPNPVRLGRCRGAVELCDVSFAYESGMPALSNLSLRIEPSTRLGIAGATGAGKTTLVNLLTRFYDPSNGEILLDGVDIRKYKLADLRNQFAIVLQEPILFSTSIAENISYGRPLAADEEIEEAARLANAHEFIVNLPDAYDTQVGERGMRLSGGERQRISLARAFLKNAPILILDEPTSSVDVKTEACIMDAIERLMAGRTTFTIAHRLSTLRQCDRVLVLDRGHMAVLTEPDAETITEAILAGDKFAKQTSH